MKTESSLDARVLEAVKHAAIDQRPVTGGTHEFYRHPARFAPTFARTVIEAFTEPGDLVFDPFVGGGTTLVEAHMLGRPSIGFDINPLAIFVSEAKTTLYSTQALREVEAWRLKIPRVLNAHRKSHTEAFWIDEGYLRNFQSTETWALRKLIAQALTSLNALSEKPRRLARCAILRTAQWAVDLRDELPSAEEFRKALDESVLAMASAARQYRQIIRSLPFDAVERDALRPVVATRSAERAHRARQFATRGTPRLVLTSPPYPGVYVLYHRWKLHARKETPLPYWIANSLDGRGISHYILGPRLEPDLKQYFENLQESFSSVASVADAETWFVQVVGFSNPEQQLPRYLATLEDAGLSERTFDAIATADDGRLWRRVPGRRWFAKMQESAANTAREVVLFHRLG